MKPIRDALCDLSLSLCKMADSCTAHAKDHALAALDGDKNAEIQARAGTAKAGAYMLACEKVDDLRRQLEAGNIG